MKAYIDPCLTHSDTVVLKNLLREINPQEGSSLDDEKTIKLLSAFNDPRNPAFEPTVFASWDLKAQPEHFTDAQQPTPESTGKGNSNGRPANASPKLSLLQAIQQDLLQTYVSWASKVVRRPTDVVFLTHVLIYLSTSVPSAFLLYCRFSWLHGICHWVMTAWYCGAFTLLLHNHIHNNGVLSKDYAWFDRAFPYILEPLMGHTWDSYYYHHVKHHHVEANGPDDLSSTIRYQRDDLYDFSIYVGRFLLFVWFELPLYFLRKGKSSLAIRSAVSEFTSYGFVCFMARYHLKATLFVLVIPLIQMRIGMMVGNFGQHAFVDEVEPDSDFRSSITLIDVPSNRYCFNDGWHTSHHLNPRRHWRDHPLAFMKTKKQYQEGRALVFHNIDYIMITYRLMRKDYDHLARCLVPIGDQIGMSHEEMVAMLKTKTKRFTEEEIRGKFRKV